MEQNEITSIAKATVTEEKNIHTAKPKSIDEININTTGENADALELWRRRQKNKN